MRLLKENERTHKRLTLDLVFAAILLLITFAGPASPQQGRTTFTGTVMVYGSGTNTRVLTSTFTMHINGLTTPGEATRLLTVLEDRGQNGLLDAMSGVDLGRFSLTGRVGEPLRAVIVDDHDGKRRLRAVFQRWIGFGEFRGGYRSTDYPFSYVELVVDPRTGRGDGTFFPAARLRFREARGNRPDTLEIEDFGTFPGKIMGVTMRGVPLL